MIEKAISLGVAKLNVNTERQLAFAAAVRKYVEAIKATVTEKMELFGSVGKA